MAQVTLKGNPVQTLGDLPKVGDKISDFQLTKTDLSTVTLKDFEGSRLIFNIFPSVDTGTCAASVRHFNQQASSLENTKVLCISRDLPFAMGRFCGAEDIGNVISLSDYATGAFGKQLGLEIQDGPLHHLHARVVIVVDESGTITHAELVPEIVDEPNYDAALAAL